MIGRRPRVSLLSLLVSTIAIVLLTSASSPLAADKRSPKVIELEGIDVIGKVAKPQVFYVLGRSTVRYEQLKLDQNAWPFRMHL